MLQEAGTRRTILDAAAEEFARFGLSGARMHAIVARAGINERMVYHHFGSKVGLYEAVLADFFRAPDLPPVEHPGDPKEVLSATLRAFVRALLARPQLVALSLHEAMSGWEHVPKASLADIPGSMRAAFERARRAGAIRKGVRFEVLYLALIGATLSTHLLASRFTDLRTAKERDRLVADVLDLVLQGAEK